MLQPGNSQSMLYTSTNTCPCYYMSQLESGLQGLDKHTGKRRQVNIILRIYVFDVDERHGHDGFYSPFKNDILMPICCQKFVFKLLFQLG